MSRIYLLISGYTIFDLIEVKYLEMSDTDTGITRGLKLVNAETVRSW